MVNILMSVTLLTDLTRRRLVKDVQHDAEIENYIILSSEETYSSCSTQLSLEEMDSYPSRLT
jgi:hypothetical protein